MSFPRRHRPHELTQPNGPPGTPSPETVLRVLGPQHPSLGEHDRPIRSRAARTGWRPPSAHRHHSLLGPAGGTAPAHRTHALSGGRQGECKKGPGPPLSSPNGTAGSWPWGLRGPPRLSPGAAGGHPLQGPAAPSSSHPALPSHGVQGTRCFCAIAFGGHFLPKELLPETPSACARMRRPHTGLGRAARSKAKKIEILPEAAEDGRDGDGDLGSFCSRPRNRGFVGQMAGAYSQPAAGRADPGSQGRG